MKPAGLLLLVPAGLALLAAATKTTAKPTADATPALSVRLKQEIRASLPAYAPPPAPVVSSAPLPPDPDSDVLVLPKVVVREKHQPRIDPNEMMTPKALYEKLGREYINSLEGLDAVLNRLSIPLISPSLADRGREIYKARKLERLNNTIESIGKVDPKAAAELKKAMTDMQRADDWQSRPAGG